MENNSAHYFTEGSDIFNVIRLKNHLGHSHLLVVTSPAVEDIEIGSVLIVPYADGYKDPIQVKLLLDEKGKPKVMNSKFAVVTEYIYH